MTPDPSLMRRILSAEVKRLALCRRGKNRLRTLLKSDDTVEVQTMVKADEGIQGRLLSVMWPKGLVDADGDFADTDEAIDSMMGSLIANGGALDIEHEGEPLAREDAHIVEVFRIQEGDPRFADWTDYDGNPVDVTGGAAVSIQIDNPDLRSAFEAGEWDGVSLFGPAAVEEVDLLAASQRVAARMGGGTPTDMTEDQIKALFAEFKAEVAEMVKSAAPAAPKADAPAEDQPAAPEAPVFSGDPMNADDLAAYEREFRAFEIRQRIASGDMSADEIAEMRKSLTERQPSVAELQEAGIDAKAEDSADVRKLQIALFKAQKGSNAPAARQEIEVDEEAELAKSVADEAAAIAAIANGRTQPANAPRVVDAR